MEDKDSSFAKDGTEAHIIGGKFLETPVAQLSGFVEGLQKNYKDIDIPHFLKTDEYTEIPEEMIGYAYKYAKEVNEMTAGFDKRWIEKTLDLSNVTGIEGEQGTADCIAVVNDNDGFMTLYVNDLKYGEHVREEADQNWQLVLYALAACELVEDEYFVEPDHIVLTIHQVRLNNTTHWLTSPDELKKELPFIREQIQMNEKIRKGEIEANITSHYNPGEHQCRWCNRGNCPGLQSKTYSTIVGEIKDMTDDNIEANIKYHTEVITDDTIARDTKMLPFIEKWVKARKKYIMDYMLKGGMNPGHKLVAGKSPARKWADPDAMDKVLQSMRLTQDERFSIKIISPTQALKHEKIKDSTRKINRLNSMIDRGTPAPTIVPESDKREVWSPKPTVDEFDDLL